ncbi:MAG: NAD-dependent epimerase/dehydratase family protein [Acidimicrobiia bacterium]
MPLIAVTGASGHLGAAVVRVALDAGHRVRAVDLRSGPGLEGLNVDFAAADVLDDDAITRALTGVELAFHLAGIISVTGDVGGQVWRTNVEGTAATARAALQAGVRRFVHCSSVHAYDLEQAGPYLDETAPRAEAAHLPVYDRSKAAGEQAVRGAIAQGLDAVMVNPTGIIGPLDFGLSRMGRVFLALRQRRLPALVEGAFDWVDVRDVADGLLRAAELGSTGENYLLSGKRLSVMELAQLAASITGVDPPRFVVPMAVARLWGPLGNWLGRRTGSPLVFTGESLHALRHSPEVRSDKAASDLGYQARPIRETVSDLYEWFDRR